MNQNDPKKHSDTKSEHPNKATSEHGKTQGVTTNPNDVGAGGGSVPFGQHGQDSRTWGSHDNQKNAPHSREGGSGQNGDASSEKDPSSRREPDTPKERSHGKSGHKEHQGDHSKDAGTGKADEQVGNPGHKLEAGKGSGHTH